MFHPHLTRNLRTLAFLLAIAAAITGVTMLWWANHTGLPESWRAAIERSVSKQGAQITIGKLSYVPFKGVIATDVRVYSEPERRRMTSRFERVILDFDKTRLARGDFHLNRIQLDHADLELPLDPTNPNSDKLSVTKAYGTIFMPGARRLEIRSARGRIAGIEVTLDARVIGYQQSAKVPPDDTSTNKWREMLAKVIDELGKWNFDADHPPAIQLSVDADVNDRSSFNAKLAMQIRSMEKNGHTLNDVEAQATLVGDLLTVTEFKASDARGKIKGHVDYNLNAREGRFDVDSSLEIPEMLTAWLSIPQLRDVLMGGRQTFEAAGDFQLDEQNVPNIRVTGHARCESVTLKGVPFKSVEGSFAWRDKSFYLRDLELIRPDGRAEGKAMVEWPLVRLALHTTLPVPVYRPFFVGQPLEKVLNDFSERPGAKVDVSLEGSFNATDRTAWAYAGGGSVRNLNYKGVPVNAANARFSLSHHELDFYDGTVVFNYRKYPLREAFDGPDEATAKVGRIRYDAPDKTVEIANVSGTFWAAPMTRLFAPKVADLLEIYRFHRPPELKASGVVDVTPQGRTKLDVSFESAHPAEYPFLGENLTLLHPSGKVRILGAKVLVNDLKVETFDGPINARFESEAGGKLTGELSWTKLAVPSLASTYGFQMKGGGDLTGRIEFAMNGGKVETMSGEGLVAIENSELFAVPMLGPLTPLIGNVLNNENAATQRAKSAFTTFSIQNGVVSSNDFQTSTHSLNFAGEGSVDMRDQTVDFTMRMNARGLLGLLTLPLRSFSGLFQFHGTGPLKAPKWESMKFTQPSETQRELLLTPPRARTVSVDP